MKKLIQINFIDISHGDQNIKTQYKIHNFKIKTYVENLCKIPCGINKPLEVNNKSSPTKISDFLSFLIISSLE